MPLTWVPPPDAISTILPSTLATLVASTIPLVLMTLSSTDFADAAVSRTVPAVRRDRAAVRNERAHRLIDRRVIAKLKRRSPEKSTVKVLAPARTTLPSAARITPSFATCSPARIA